MRGMRGVRKSIDQSLLAKGLGLGLLCWGFKGVQEEIPSKEAITLQIGSLRRGLEFHVCTINKSAHTKKNLETYLMILVSVYFPLRQRVSVRSQINPLSSNSFSRRVHSLDEGARGYRRKKETRQPEFKSLQFAFHIALMLLRKAWIQQFSFQLWVNSRADWAFLTFVWSV